MGSWFIIPNKTSALHVGTLIKCCEKLLSEVRTLAPFETNVHNLRGQCDALDTPSGQTVFVASRTGMVYHERRGIDAENACKSTHDRTTKMGGQELRIEFRKSF